MDLHYKIQTENITIRCEKIKQIFMDQGWMKVYLRLLYVFDIYVFIVDYFVFHILIPDIGIATGSVYLLKKRRALYWGEPAFDSSIATYFSYSRFS